MEKLVKNNLGQWLLVEESLEKTNQPKFKNGSILHVNRATTKHGYEIIEETKSGEKLKHPDVKFNHLDRLCNEHSGRVRIEDCKDKSKDLYHQMRVEHRMSSSYDSALGRRERVAEHLVPHGEPWRKGIREEKEV